MRLEFPAQPVCSLPKQIPQCDFGPKYTPRRPVWQAPTILRIASVLLNYRPPAEQGSTAKMPRCLQGDAFRVTDDAFHLQHERWGQGFAFALQELRFAAQEL